MDPRIENFHGRIKMSRTRESFCLIQEAKKSAS